MLKSIHKKKFEKDIKRLRRQGKDLNKIKSVMNCLVSETPLDHKLRDHALKGEFSDCRECHIEPDWLLIYLVTDDSIIFIRSGSHAELFK